jgi:hypothetical protein
MKMCFLILIHNKKDADLLQPVIIFLSLIIKFLIFC